jgi:neutral ceramidase
MKSKNIVLIAITFYACLLLSEKSGISQAEEGILRGGVAKIEITPDLPVMLYGYSSRKTPSEGIHDPLFARVVVFECKGNKVVIVSTDIGSYGNDAYPGIKESILEKFNLKESELFLSTIHSHSSPILSLNNESAYAGNIKYTETLNQKLLNVIGDALNNLKPVQTGCGIGYSPVGSNRREMRSDGSITLGRNPYGPTDKEVLVMKVTTDEGKPIGAIYDYATHSTALGPRNMLISGDVLGLSAQFVEKILGEEVISPVFAGASGNIDPWYRILPGFNDESGWIPEPVLLGTLLGEEVVTVFRNINQRDERAKITTAFATLECPGINRSDNNSSPAEGKNTTVPVNITAARVGDDVAFIGFGVEMLTEIGMEIKAGSPFKYTFIITHCNGSSGYLAPAGLYKEGGYEISSTRFEIGSSEMVVKKALRMLYDL